MEIVTADLRMILLRLQRHGLTVEKITDECHARGVVVSDECISKIRRGITKDPGYRLGKALEALARQYGEEV